MPPLIATENCISVVVPLWNEEAGLDQLRHSLLRLGEALAPKTDLQIVFVDDGSTDRTVERLREIYQDDKNSMIVEHGRNRGIGAAFRTGFEKCKGAFVCTIDADCTYKPEGLVQLLTLLEHTGADIAVASPYHPRGRVEGVPPWRLMLSRFCSVLYRIISGVRLYTYTSVFRAYRRSVIETVRFHSDGFVSAAELLVKAAHQGYRIVEAPMTLRGRQTGTSKMKVFRTIRTHLRFIATLLGTRIGVSNSASDNRSRGLAKAALGDVEFSIANAKREED